MFSRAQAILGAFDRQAEKDTTEVPEELEKQEDVVFHTLGNLHQYKDVLLEDTEDDFETFISKGADALIKEHPDLVKRLIWGE